MYTDIWYDKVAKKEVVPYNYQQFAIEHIIEREVAEKYKGGAGDKNAGEFLDLGLGKTVVTLTAVHRLMYDMGEINRVLIIAPKRVARDTWTDEIAKWQHLSYFRVSKILGNESQRKKAMATKADIYIINREMLVWLVAQLGGHCPYDMIVIDELSSFKTQSSGRYKALRKIAPMVKKIVGLTATPASNGLIDLWAQMYILDRGQRLGKTITGYREAYFKEPFRVNSIPVSSYQLRGDDKNDIEKNPSAREIFGCIKDMCISMRKEDYLKLPPRIDQITHIKLSPALMAQYKQFEKEAVLSMDDGQELTSFSAAGLHNKLLQFTNGAVYTGKAKGEYIEIHNEKIEALGELIEAANGNPMLVAYSFQSDLARIKKHLAYLKPRLLNSTADMQDWNAGKIPFAVGHSQSLGHGLNLQAGGHLMAWFGVGYDLEYYTQFIGRLDRQGQVTSVINQRILADNTIDMKVVEALLDKTGVQDALHRAVRAIVKSYRK